MPLSRINKIFIFLTSIIWIATAIFPEVLSFSAEVFLGMVFLFGIPHGALDHIMHFKGASASTKKTLLFYSKYIILIIAVGALWYAIPEIMFILFLFISAHHFGQSQLFKFDLPSFPKHLFYLSWGTLLLSGIIGFNYNETLSIFNSFEFINAESWVSPNLWLISGGISFLVFTGFSFYLLKHKTSLSDVMEEWLILTLLLLISITGNAVFTFAIYFGIWHSFRSLVIEYKEFSTFADKFSLSNFLSKITPFSLLAIAFLIGSYFLLDSYSIGLSPYMFFIIFISTLTVPHLFVMNKIYEGFTNN